MSVNLRSIDPSPRCPRCGSLVSAVTWTCVLGQFCPGERSSAPETWHHAGELAEQIAADIANKAKSKTDTEPAASGFTLE